MMRTDGNAVYSASAGPPHIQELPTSPPIDPHPWQTSPTAAMLLARARANGAKLPGELAPGAYELELRNERDPARRLKVRIDVGSAGVAQIKVGNWPGLELRGAAQNGQVIDKTANVGRHPLARAQLSMVITPQPNGLEALVYWYDDRNNTIERVSYAGKLAPRPIGP